MNRFSTFYLLPLVCISFAPAQVANRELVCSVTLASVIDTSNPTDSQTFTSGSINLYKTFNSNLRKTFYQVEDNAGKKSIEFAMDPNSTVVIGNEISARGGTVTALLTVSGNTSALYQDVFSLSSFTDLCSTVYFQAFEEANTTDINTIKSKSMGGVYIFAAYDGDTPRLIFPSQRMKSISFNHLNEGMSFTLEADRDIPIMLEFNTIIDAERLYKLVSKG